MQNVFTTNVMVLREYSKFLNVAIGDKEIIVNKNKVVGGYYGEGFNIVIMMPVQCAKILGIKH